MAQLHDQHDEQYMQHVHSQLQLHQRQQFTQLQALRHQHDVAMATTSPSNVTCHHDNEVIVGGGVNGAASDKVADTMLSAAVDEADDGCHGNHDTQDYVDADSDLDEDDTGNLCCNLCKFS